MLALTALTLVLMLEDMMKITYRNREVYTYGIRKELLHVAKDFAPIFSMLRSL